jgi:anti-sigma regulatory factor (Ser/Thr protein kinase)
VEPNEGNTNPSPLVRENQIIQARIAVYDSQTTAPHVVVVEQNDVRSFLAEVTKQVNDLSHEQGGTIPFMVIREVVENLIHAYFQEPAISILADGNTIRFADQGPGIREKARALEYGTTSATEEMKRYIRGVGSGLPYAQQYLEDKGGSLEIEDNIIAGTIVTIRMPSARPVPAPMPVIEQQQQPPQQDKDQIDDKTAQQLLNSAQQDEKNVQRKVQQNPQQRRSLEKDW